MSAIDGLKCDVLVVGGGPAGLAAAIALRLKGFSVTVADARQPPIDSACGEGILPAGVDALGRLGVSLSAADGFPFRGIRFVEGAGSVEAPFPRACGIGVRRTRLHALLTRRADELDVRLLWGTHIAKAGLSANPSGLIVNASGLTANASGLTANASGLTANPSGLSVNPSELLPNASELFPNASELLTNPSGLSANPSELFAIASGLSAFEWIVGADGQQSVVRRAAGLDAALSLSRRFGFRRHYRLAPWSDMVEVHWGARCQFYVTPVAPDEIGVALLTRDSHLRIDAALSEFPALSRRLANAACTSSDRGSSISTRRLWHVTRNRTALVGDASGSLDAIAGEGLSLAFLQAHALADAICAGDLRAYQARHRRLARRPLVMANLLLLLDRLSWLRPMIWRGLVLEPSLLSRVLAAYTPGGRLASG